VVFAAIVANLICRKILVVEHFKGRVEVLEVHRWVMRYQIFVVNHAIYIWDDEMQIRCQSTVAQTSAAEIIQLLYFAGIVLMKEEG
jgi:hypothetical protein